MNRLHALLFVFLWSLVIVLAGWLSQQHRWQWDWTEQGRNSLSEPSVAVLAQLPGPVEITAYARPDPTLRGQIRTFIGLYQRHKPDLILQFLNPDLYPEEVRAQGISGDGELVIRYDERLENLSELKEQALTQILQRLSRSHSRSLYFLTGHGERSPGGQANHDWSEFNGHLSRKGIRVLSLNLAEARSIPEDASALVIADPRLNIPQGEMNALRRWLTKGGNLWLLQDEKSSLQATDLVLEWPIATLPGVVVDKDSRRYDFAMVSRYEDPHPITQGLKATTVFPRAIAYQMAKLDTGWRVLPLLKSQARSWNERSTNISKAGNTLRLQPELGERQGPLLLGLSAERQRPSGKGIQRALIVGDADFLANTWLGNGGNLELGLRMADWMAGDDDLIQVPVRAASDKQLQLDVPVQTGIGVFFLVALPAGLLLMGWWIRRRRRRR